MWWQLAVLDRQSISCDDSWQWLTGSLCHGGSWQYLTSSLYHVMAALDQQSVSCDGSLQCLTGSICHDDSWQWLTINLCHVMTAGSGWLTVYVMWWQLAVVDRQSVSYDSYPPSYTVTKCNNPTQWTLPCPLSPWTFITWAATSVLTVYLVKMYMWLHQLIMGLYHLASSSAIYSNNVYNNLALMYSNHGLYHVASSSADCSLVWSASSHIPSVTTYTIPANFPLSFPVCSQYVGFP